MQNKFHERFKECLEEKGLSQSEFARRAGVAQTTITQYFSRGSEPTLDILIKICIALGETSDYLLGLKD